MACVASDPERHTHLEGSQLCIGLLPAERCSVQTRRTRFIMRYHAHALNTAGDDAQHAQSKLSAYRRCACSSDMLTRVFAPASLLN